MDPTVQDIKLVPSVKPLANYTDKNMILRIPMSVLSVDQDMIKVRLPNAKLWGLQPAWCFRFGGAGTCV